MSGRFSLRASAHMPLFEDRIEVIRNTEGYRQIACIHCHQIAERAKSIGDMPSLLMCPQGKVTLGEWETDIGRETEMIAFLLRHG
jgi:hypothetical protein